jgi:Na+/proline symporter/signal transduction histidine kinase/CheY-like chemotaxis protein
VIPPWAVAAAILAYCTLLFLVAMKTESLARGGRNIADHPVVYSLTLAVYCTSWTYYGSVGKAATSGLLFLTVYLGPTATILVWWTVLRKLVRIKEAHHITSIADLVSARYDRSPAVAAVSTVVAVAGITPYLALQMKSLETTFRVVSGSPAGGGEGWWLGIAVVAMLSLFTVWFGARRLDPTERHDGMMMALATECVVKLFAFLAAGVFVTWYLHDGFGDVISRAQGAGFLSSPLPDTEGGASPFILWTTYMTLSGSAILFLPRQFHVSVVENHDERHILTAMWLFPLYMVLINLFVLPIAAAGLASGLPPSSGDTYVLTLPLAAGNRWLALLVFLGGFSAATGMAIVATMTVSTMVTNHAVVPLAEFIPSLAFLRRHLLTLRRAAIVAVLLCGFVFERMVGGSLMLVNMGILSFAAVIQFAPAVLGALFWPRANRTGALAGLSAGFALWCYTLLLPAFVRGGYFSPEILSAGPFGIDALNPEHLFGLSVLDPLSHGVFWTLAANIGLYAAGSILFEQSHEERRIAEEFADILLPPAEEAAPRGGRKADIDFEGKREIVEAILREYFPPERAREIVSRCLADLELAERSQVSVVDLVQFYGLAETYLAGALGAAGAHRAFQREELLSGPERGALSRAYAGILADMKLSPQQLRTKVDYYREREELLTRSSEELREKVVALDAEIAERKRAEESLHRLAAAVEQAAEVVVISDPSGAIQYVNPAFRSFLGGKDGSGGDGAGTGGGTVSVPAHALDLLDRVVPVEMIEEVRRELAQGGGWKGTVSVRRDDDALAEAECTASPVRDASGSVVNYVVVCRDVTAERKIEGHLRQSQKLDAIGTLAGGIAHDFNNILQPLLGFAELAKGRAGKDPLLAGYLEKILSGGMRARDLVSQILAFARRTEQERKPVLLQGLVRETMQFLRASIPASVELRQKIAPEPTGVFGDATQLNQVLVNLCTNAAQAMRGGGVLTVRLSPVDVDEAMAATHPGLRVGPHALLSVSDTGTGMSRAVQARIFEPFFTTKPKGEGTGLGLSVVHGIVQNHDGIITVYSEEGKGSTFNVYLPRVAVSSGGAEAAAETPPSGNEAILFVDDEPMIRELAVESLSLLGYDVTAAVNGTDAMEKFRESPKKFRIVVTDYTMPDMNGVVLSGMIHKLEPGLPVILCSGYMPTLSAEEVKSHGIRRFLLKPLTIKELGKAVHSCLHGGEDCVPPEGEVCPPRG